MPGENKSWLEQQAEQLVIQDIINEAAYDLEQTRLRKAAQDAYIETMNSIQARMMQEFVAEIDRQVFEEILALGDPVVPKKITLNTSLDLIHSPSIIAKPKGMIYIPDDIEKLIVVPNAIGWIMERHNKSANELSRLHRRTSAQALREIPSQGQ